MHNKVHLRLKRLLPSKKNCFICINESPACYFIIKALFVLKISQEKQLD